MAEGVPCVLPVARLVVLRALKLTLALLILYVQPVQQDHKLLHGQSVKIMMLESPPAHALLYLMSSLPSSAHLRRRASLLRCSWFLLHVPQ